MRFIDALKGIIAFSITLLSVNGFAFYCDCRLLIFSPLTGSHRLDSVEYKSYTLETFSKINDNTKNACRLSCSEKFNANFKSDDFYSIVYRHAEELIQSGAIGYNCTGQTTLKFPVKIKASLGHVPLGNVADFIQVVTYEKSCFD